MKKKSQISFEFILIFSLVLLVLVGFIYLIKTRMAEIGEEQEEAMMKDLANNIKNEVMLASSVNNKYLRRFEIPYKINGKEYTMDISHDELTISLFENDEVSRTYFTVFPVSVKGTFVEKFTVNTTEHCITKNDVDGIRISQNQASIDALKPDDNTQDDIDLIVNEGDTFDLLMSLNCVENIRSVQFTIKYDPSVLEIRKVIQTDMYTRENNPLFDEVTAYSFEDRPPIYINDNPYNYIDNEEGRYTYGMISEECSSGSGSIAKLTFKAIAKTDRTLVEFEDLFGDLNLRILDCETNAFTKEDMPDTKKGSVIKII